MTAFTGSPLRVVHAFDQSTTPVFEKISTWSSMWRRSCCAEMRLSQLGRIATLGSTQAEGVDDATARSGQPKAREVQKSTA